MHGLSSQQAVFNTVWIGNALPLRIAAQNRPVPLRPAAQKLANSNTLLGTFPCIPCGSFEQPCMQAWKHQQAPIYVFPLPRKNDPVLSAHIAHAFSEANRLFPTM